MREPPGAGAAMMAALVSELLLLAQIVMAWAVIRFVGSAAGATEQVAAAAAIGVAGWWLRFSWIEARVDEFVTDRIGPRPPAGSQAPLSAQLTWKHCGKLHRGFRKLLWTIAVASSIVHGWNAP